MARKIQGSLDIAQINGEDLASAAIPVTMDAVPTGGATAAKQDTIIGHVDGIETLLTTLNGYVDAVETKLDTIAGYIDGIETKQDTANTALAGIVTALTGASSPWNWLTQGDINDQVIANSAKTLLSLNCNNTHSSNWLYVKLYNKATAPDPSGGVDIPVLTLAVPPADTHELRIPTNGVYFSTGIAVVIVGGFAHNDETAVAYGQGIAVVTYR